MVFFFVFFFRAEDGIRGGTVTGVQTCALPISAVKVWLKDPKTILVYEGQHLAERHLADQVTLISPDNEAVTILIDAQSHLPLRRSFQWRDPLYHDKNTDYEEYD